MATVGQEPALSRRALAERVCDWLNWTNAQGQRCLGSARRALAELHRRGAVTLPAATPFPAGPRPAPATVAPAPLPVAEVTGDLAALGPIDLVVVDTAAERATYHQLLAQHPLGDQPLCGAQLRYLFHGPQGYLGAAACQSASFALKDRDQWIGWSEATRRGNLARVVANARFLILPGVRVPHLASHLLGQLARRLPTDWKARYGVRPLLLVRIPAKVATRSEGKWPLVLIQSGPSVRRKAAGDSGQSGRSELAPRHGMGVVTRGRGRLSTRWCVCASSLRSN